MSSVRNYCSVLVVSKRFCHHYRTCTSRMYRPAMVLPPGSKQSVLSCKSQRLMMEHGLIRQSSPGVYHLLPLALRSLEKLIRLIDEEMHSIGGTKISMPCMTTSELWKATNRWETNGPELFKVEDRHGIQYCLGPTHEEAVTDLIASQGRLSHKQLPLRIYQITRKFRDEKRPRFGLLRGREFYMKDMYTFDANTENAIKTYEAVNQAYCRLFNRLQLHFVKVSADTGSIGGSMSHEYHLPADTGEDELWFCNRCGFGANKELGDIDIEHCSHCGTTNSLESRQGIEVGHAFYLGTKYSKVFNADYSDSNNQTRTTEMGCYGLGVTRILAAAIEVSSTDNEIRWPHLLAPYQIYIIPSKDGSKEAGAQPIAVGLYDQIVSHLPHLKHEIILDDRNHMTIGKRMKEAKSLGYPFVIVIGKKALQPEPLFELCNVNTGETRYLNTCDLFCTLSMDVNII